MGVSSPRGVIVNKGYIAEPGAGGTVLQSAVRSSARIPASLQGQTLGELREAVVLATYWPEDDDRPWCADGQQRMVTCDVRTIGLRSQYLTRVPVLQFAQGLDDEDVFIPRAPSMNIADAGAALATEASADGPSPTPAESMDADRVLVAFLNNSPERAIILPLAFSHPLEADGLVRRIRRNGTLVEWDKDGNLTIDARGSISERFGARGAGVSTSGTGGKIRLITKDAAGDESSVELDALGGVRIVDAAGNAVELVKSTGTATITGTTKVQLGAPSTELSDVSTDPVLLGNAVKATMETLLSAWVTAAGSLAGTPAAAYGSAVVQAANAAKAQLADWLSAKVTTG